MHKTFKEFRTVEEKNEEENKFQGCHRMLLNMSGASGSWHHSAIIASVQHPPLCLHSTHHCGYTVPTIVSTQHPPLCLHSTHHCAYTVPTIVSSQPIGQIIELCSVNIPVQTVVNDLTIVEQLQTQEFLSTFILEKVVLIVQQIF